MKVEKEKMSSLLDMMENGRFAKAGMNLKSEEEIGSKVWSKVTSLECDIESEKQKIKCEDIKLEK